jgi:hypothetical protein
LAAELAFAASVASFASMDLTEVMERSASANRSSSLTFKLRILRSGTVACATSRDAVKTASLA